jgi:hypothetical protein
MCELLSLLSQMLVMNLFYKSAEDVVWNKFKMYFHLMSEDYYFFPILLTCTFIHTNQSCEPIVMALFL